MKLKNKIIPKSDFQYSVNIDFDLNSDEKIRGYIPTVGGLNIIEDVMLSAIPTSRDRARLFVGAYGKGKSHLVLTILALLSKKDKSLFTSVLNKAREENKQFYNYLEDYIASDRRLLPVVIQGSSSDTTTNFLLSLKSALQSNNLESVLPDTYFTSAIQTIENWKNNYKDTYNKFLGIINEDIEKFITKLSLYNVETYQRFVNIYPTLTSGSDFVPTKGLDVVKVYEDVAKKIKPYGFNGIFVVYDEFSKFLENSIGKTSAMEIKMIQDFAEMCNRSGDNQLHLLLISHKHIQNYISQLPKEKIDAWKAVSERFKTVEINNNFTQTYEIISTVIQKDNNWFEMFKKEHKQDFDLLKESADKLRVFSDIPEKNANELIYKTYPLDSSSLFILPRISELVAQNERTIFTFLASSQKNSLSDFINNVDVDFPLITPDYIYDYFEQLFKNENYNSQTHKIWDYCRTAIAKLESKTNNVLSYKILKALAVILIMQQKDIRLSPTFDTLRNIYYPVVKDIEKINGAFKELKQHGAIKISDYNNHISIAKGSDIDLQKTLEDAMIKYKNVFNAKEELNAIIKDNYLYPARYNDENTIVRYFKTEFIRDFEVLDIDNWEKKISTVAADGVVYLILEDGNISKTVLKDKLAEIKNDRIVFVRLTKQFKVEKSLLKLQAIKFIINNASEEDRKLLKDELSVYEEDCLKIITEFLDAYLRPELQYSIYINNGVELRRIKRKSSVSQLLSEICEKTFTNTPKINNELINKNNITTPIFNARNKVLNALLQNELKPNLGLVGSGPEINIMRSILFASGIMKENESTLNSEKLEDENAQLVISKIRDFFISSANEKKNFAELYDELVLPANHIGLKMGVIPVYLAVVFHLYKQHSVITNASGKELEIKAETIENINKTPSSYYLILEDWSEEKQSYINQLEEIFQKRIIQSEREYNTFDYVVKAMQRWFLELPKFTKEADQIYVGDEKFNKLDVKVKKLRNQLKSSDLNSRELLFDKIPTIFGKEPNKQLANEVGKAKSLLDNLLPDTCDYLGEDISKLFNGKENASFVSILKDWEEKLKPVTKTYLFNNSNEMIFEYIRQSENNDSALFAKITKHISGLRITDWEDNTILTFLKSLKAFKEEVEEKDKAGNINNTSQTGVYKITYVDENGNEEVKILNRVENSRRAGLLDNDITSLLEEYGESITTNEKRQVLLDILQKLK